MDQWPLERKKLSALKNLVQEQLQKGHIKPTDSPWNSPVFIIKKKLSGKWRLLHDLRKINEVIEDMGPLQLGLPSVSMIPRDWPLVVVDLKDCFFSIPLHPDDAPRFAFSVPRINKETPLQWYHWVVLPQGLKNSPTICQWYVARALAPARKKFPKAKIIHYMDDLLIAASIQQELQEARNCVIAEVQKAGLEISISKIQEVTPWKYLGWKISQRTIKPQKMEISTKINNLHDLQQLLGEINWMRPILGITNSDIPALLDLLRGDTDIRSPRTLTQEAKKELEKVTGAIQKRQAHRFVPLLPFQLAVLGKKTQLRGLIFQWDESQKDSLIIIEWVFLSHRPSKTILTDLEIAAQIIIKARTRLLTMAGQEFSIIRLPLKQVYLDWAMQQSKDLLIALLAFPGTCTINFPEHKILQSQICYRAKPRISEEPLEGITVFTDGSGKTHKSVITWRNSTTGDWDSDVKAVQGSPQIVELAAVARAFQLFEQPLNLVTDSAYVAGVVKRLEGSLLKEVSNEVLYSYLVSLKTLLESREREYFITHIRAHTTLPGFLAEGNAQADRLTMPISQTLLDIFEQARLSHAFFHQNAQALMESFRLTKSQAREIISACPDCQLVQPPASTGAVNPRGLQSLQLWQADVTKYPSFGRLKNVHVCRHFLQAFASLGVP